MSLERIGSCLLAIALTSAAAAAQDLDHKLRKESGKAGVIPLEPAPAFASELVELGQLLFFDKVLSGNLDVACATCHHPLLATGDGVSLGAGVGGAGLGPFRVLGEGRELIPRNAPEIFNRAQSTWTSQFWDSRVAHSYSGFDSPAGDELPASLDSLLAVQAMFPVTSGDEMLGHVGENEVADETTLTGVWQRLADRLLSIPEYVDRFTAAFPGEEIGYSHAARAIAAFESVAFTLTDSPFNKYLLGDDDALGDAAKRGALLFFGKAKCSACHGGPLLTDQRHYSIGVPQMGPGKLPESPLDFGRFRVTGDNADLYAFRTPTLHNVAATGPWMHDGVYTNLLDAVRHHYQPEDSLRNYNGEFADAVIDAPEVVEDMVSAIDLKKTKALKPDEEGQLLAFLNSLTSRALDSGDLELLIPASVPSGLPVDR